MTAAHTPGPWRHAPTNSARLTYVAVSTVQGSNGSTVVIGQCAGPDKEANARLIAAAPEMLEALRLVVEKFGQVSPEKISMGQQRALCEARAAIAKAIGAA